MTTKTTNEMKKKIVTHNGTFHCDEVLACHMLQSYVSEFKNSEIIRTRDPKIIETGDIVVDVGAIYDVSKNRYDHHQREFTTKFDYATPKKEACTKLSSAGLIYKHYGEEIVKSVLSKIGFYDTNQDDLLKIYYKVYDSFMHAIDAIDNGVQQYESKEQPRYISGTDLSSRIGSLNPDWYEINQNPDINFKQAMLVAGNEFESCVKHIANSWLPARLIVNSCFDKRFEDHASGQIVIIREWAPWKDHIYQLENEHDLKKTIQYVVYKDSTGDTWRIQCVPVAQGSFTSRKPMPEKWRGIRDDELSNITDIDGCVFVHASGFIGGNKTFEGAMEMAVKALES